METYLVLRTDGLGDLILALPVAEAIKDAKPEARVYYAVSPMTSEIASACPFIDGVIEYDEAAKGPSPVFRLVRAVRRLGPAAAIFLRPTMRTALACLAAGVPRRVGTSYRYYSFMFNQRCRQHRKFADRHELEYNLDVLRVLLDVEERRYTPAIRVPSSAADFADRVLAEKGLKAKSFVIIHPGSGGSARNLSLRSYARVADLIETDFRTRVLVTAGREETALIDQMDTYRAARSLTVADVPRLLDLAAVIERATLVISGSTGPMHLAAAVGTPTVSFFSPVRSCSPRRWGPVGENGTVLMPPVPECPTCEGRSCDYFDCMSLITEDMIAETLEPLLKQRPD